MAALLSVAQAQAQLLAMASPLAHEVCPVEQAGGRILAEAVIAARSNPPVDVSAMDGFAIRFADLAAGAHWRIVGEAAAGQPCPVPVTPETAVRIFTGAPVPAEADTILVQEDASWQDETLLLTGNGPPERGAHIRKAGQDFQTGGALVPKGLLLTPVRLALAAMGGSGHVVVSRRPRVAIFATGNELVPPGATPGPTQIVSVNSLMIGQIARACGADVQDLGIAADTPEALDAMLARAAGADVIVSSGGASVGDHDLVQPALKRAGAEIGFWRIAMRPGKPLMAARLGSAIVLGLPGNPVSAFVTAQLFLLPLLRALQGAEAPLPVLGVAFTTVALPENGTRADYQRAYLEDMPQGPSVTPLTMQDSAHLSGLARANALIVRPALAPKVRAGQWVDVLRLPYDNQM